MTKDRAIQLVRYLRAPEELPLAVKRNWYNKQVFDCEYIDRSVLPNMRISGSGNTPERAREDCIDRIRELSATELISYFEKLV